MGFSVVELVWVRILSVFVSTGLKWRERDGEKHDKQSRLEENLKVIKAKNQGNEQEKRRKDN